MSAVDERRLVTEGLTTSDVKTEEARSGSRFCLPDGYEPVPYQVAGHMYQHGKRGMLRRRGGQSGVLLKPVQYPPKGQREVDFYRSVFCTEHCDAAEMECLCRLRPFLPQFKGVSVLDNGDCSQEYLCLEDLVAPFRRPNILDLKMGKRCWDDLADQEKIRTEQKKYPPQERIGYRIVGMRVHDWKSDSVVHYDKQYGRSLDEDSILSGLRYFFTDITGQRNDVLLAVHRKLQELCRWFEEQQSLRFFASSLLVLYDSATATEDSRCEVDVRMIDFAHTYWAPGKEGGRDENYLCGLRNLISALGQLLQSSDTANAGEARLPIQHSRTRVILIDNPS